MSGAASLPANRLPPLRTARGERTTRRILDAGEALFAVHGFAGTTLRDVATAVGIRTPSLYNHFPSKEDLYAAVLERGMRPVLELLGEFVGAGDPGRQGVLLERALKLLGARPNLLRLIQFEMLTGGTRLTRALRDRVALVFERAAAVVSGEPGARPWPEDHVPLLVLAMYHVVVGYFTIAPFYRDLSGEDLTSSEALERQTRFLREVVSRLLPEDPGSGSRG